MKFLWVFSIKDIKQFLLVATAFIITFVIIYNEKDNISVFINSKETNAIYSVETKKKQIALTFDISWGDVRQGPILDILEENGLMGKVTFFLSSPWSQEHPETINRIVQSGYEIGNHGDKHLNYTDLEAEDIKYDIVKAGNILYTLTGQRPNLIRTPNGTLDNNVLTITKELGYTVIQWDTDSKDWTNPGVNEIVSRVLTHVHPGDIILMHASDSSKQTHEALPIIIDRLKKEGYIFLTVSQLISDSKIDLSEIK
ncbi:MAG: polysaccharide deacetylase family sporulation protein PdaB [Vulcanibacillus sp.]